MSGVAIQSDAAGLSAQSRQGWRTMSPTPFVQFSPLNAVPALAGWSCAHTTPGPIHVHPQSPLVPSVPVLSHPQSWSSNTISPSFISSVLVPGSLSTGPVVGWCSASASNRGVGQSRFDRNFPADRRKSINVHCVAVDNETISFLPEVVRCWIN